MTAQDHIFRITEVGEDFAVFSDVLHSVRYNFADAEGFTKEIAAAFFRGRIGEKVSVGDAKLAGNGAGKVYICVDLWQEHEDTTKVIPIPFTVSSVEMSL